MTGLLSIGTEEDYRFLLKSRESSKTINQDAFLRAATSASSSMAACAAARRAIGTRYGEHDT